MRCAPTGEDMAFCRVANVTDSAKWIGQKRSKERIECISCILKRDEKSFRSAKPKRDFLCIHDVAAVYDAVRPD